MDLDSVARSENLKRTDPALKPDQNRTMEPKFRGPRKKHKVEPNFPNHKDFQALGRTDGLKLRLESLELFGSIATYGPQNRHISATSTLFTTNFNILASQKATGPGGPGLLKPDNEKRSTFWTGPKADIQKISGPKGSLSKPPGNTVGH